MRVSVLVTDNGPHPADKLAESAAGEIMDLVKVDPDRPSDTAADKSRKQSYRKTRMYLEADILEALTPHHETVQKLEKSLLAESDNRLYHPLRPDSGTVENAVGVVVGAAHKYGEPWSSSFADEGAKAMIHDIVFKHFRTAMDIERSWHSDQRRASGKASETVWQYHLSRHG